MRKQSRQQIKHHNTRLLLKTLYEEGDLSRADLARETGLTRPTVSTLVGDLLADDLIIELETAPSAGGKPPTPLAFNGNSRQILVLDLGGTTFQGALINLRGEITLRRERPLGEETGEAAAALVTDLVDELQTAASTPLLGLAAASPGLVDPQTGIVHQAVNLGWEELPLRERLADRTGLPVYLTNDSQAAALGEFAFGPPRTGRSLVLVKIGRGVGAGLVLDGRPFYGDGFAAGEIGHVVVDPGGPLCRCGNRGCLETIASTRALIAQASSLLGREPVAWGDIGAALATGDPAVIDLVARTGRAIGAALAPLIAAFNVHHIVFAGPIEELGERLLAEARAEAARRALPRLVAATELHFSTLGGDGVLLGTAALVLKNELGVIE